MTSDKTMEHDEDAPATTGDVRIASFEGLGGYALYRWPMKTAGYWTPAEYLHVRVMDNGEICLAIEEDWEDSQDD